MQLFIRSQENYVFNFSEDTIISDVKAFIAEKEGLPLEDVVLYVGGSPLGRDDEVLSPEFAEGSLDVTVRLLGGKVHGSLARAGKVKGQTPKVEKQEKKKKKTGRAKRRIQYNRRFVNVVATIGKRRGPNSNST